jgi:two-component system chemotaxis response regulator CheB
METKQSIEATCPECRGPLSEVQNDNLREYSCLVGHTFSARGMLLAHSQAQEKALWAAVVALEESVNLVRLVAPQLPEQIGKRLQRQAEEKLLQALEIRKILERLEPFQTD